MTAVILGLLLVSAKGYQDNLSLELTEMSARIVVLDRNLAHCDPEAKDARDQLRETVVRILDKIWTEQPSKTSKAEPGAAGEVIFDKIQGLSPQNDVQRCLQARA